jgi:ribulose-5-phosphate 4-epimerase/fuculose-1-phosphate aldolase
MSGGYLKTSHHGGTFSDKVVITRDGSTFDDITPLPLKLAYHSLVIVNDTTLFVSGGMKPSPSARTFIYNKSRYLCS